jgi:hypothetical protein
VIIKNVNYLGHSNLVSDQDSAQVGNQDTDQDVPANLEEKIFDFCSSPQQKRDLSVFRFMLFFTLY